MRRWAILLMLASGFAGLGYQIAWAQQGAVWIGHEAAAMLAIVAAFFGGIALGAGSLGRRIDASARPAPCPSSSSVSGESRSFFSWRRPRSCCWSG
jgi:hypothetical protein